VKQLRLLGQLSHHRVTPMGRAAFGALMGAVRLQYQY
jgi:hypothetical protein